MAASQPWNKQDKEWTAADVDQILSDSPWARTASASFDTPGDESEAVDVANLPGPESAGLAGAGRRGATDGKWDGGVAHNPRGGTVKLPVTVRWENALPVRTAWNRSQPTAGPLDEDSAKEYVVTVTGLLPATKRQDDIEGDSMDARNRKQETLSALMGQTGLSRKGRPLLRPDNVRVDAATGIVRFYFPKTDTISLGDKEVTFVTQYGQMRVQQRFRLKEMVYQGKLEL
jgi:hypothetical protein